jgi:hypothetical protein
MANGLDAPPDFSAEARTISTFRGLLESQKLASMDPGDAKAEVSTWHGQIQDMTAKLAAQLNHSR